MVTNYRETGAEVTMKQFTPARSLLLDRAILVKEAGRWYGRLFKRIVEWFIFGGRL